MTNFYFLGTSDILLLFWLKQFVKVTFIFLTFAEFDELSITSIGMESAFISDLPLFSK